MKFQKKFIIAYLLLPVNFLHAHELNMRGSVTYMYGGTNEKSGYNISAGEVNAAGYGDPSDTLKTRKRNLNSEADMYLNYHTQISQNWYAGAYSGLKVNTNAMANSRYSMPRTYVYLESKAGKFEFGSNYSASEAMAQDARRLGLLPNGIGGSWYRFANLATGVTSHIKSDDQITVDINKSNFFLVHPDMLESLDHARKKESSRKVTFYTAKPYGMQLGLSYIKSTLSTGDKSKFVGNPSASCCDTFVSTSRANIIDYPHDVLAAGLTSESSFENIDFKMAVTANYQLQKYSLQEVKSHRLREGKISGLVTLGEYQIAGSWQDSGRSLKQKYIDRKGTRGFTLGASYVKEPFSATATIFSSKSDGNRFNLYSIGTTFNYIPYTTSFIELTYFEFQPSFKNILGEDIPSRNKGNVLIFGSRLNF